MPLNFGPARGTLPEDQISEKLDQELRLDIVKLGIKDVFSTVSTPEEKEALFRQIAEIAGCGHLLKPLDTPTIELPTVAPALWMNREDKQQGLSEFIAATYGPWLGKGLTRAHIHKLDAPLYNALAKWVTVNKTMPEGIDLPTKSEQVTRDLIGFGAYSPAIQSPLDPQQAKERMRLNSAAIRRQAQTSSPKP